MVIPYVKKAVRFYPKWLMDLEIKTYGSHKTILLKFVDRGR